MGYPNLKAEMVRSSVKPIDIAKAIGITLNNVYPLLNGSRKLTVRRAIKIHKLFFPDLDFEYLFYEDDADCEVAAHAESQTPGPAQTRTTLAGA